MFFNFPLHTWQPATAQWLGNTALEHHAECPRCLQLYCSWMWFKSLVEDQCEDSKHSSAWLTMECSSSLKKHFTVYLSSMWYGNKMWTSFNPQFFRIHCCVSLLIWAFILFPCASIIACDSHFILSCFCSLNFSFIFSNLLVFRLEQYSSPSLVQCAPRSLLTLRVAGGASYKDTIKKDEFLLVNQFECLQLLMEMCYLA